MKKRRRDQCTVMFGLPTYTGKLHVGTMQMLMGEGRALEHRGDRFLIEDRCGGADIAGNRNDMLACFLSSQATHLFFIDDDVVCARNGVLRLLDHGQDFAAAVYPKREEPIKVALKYIDGAAGPVAHESGLLEVAGVSAGFMCITRKVARKMVRHYAKMQYISQVAPQNRAWAVFDHYWYEDDQGRHRLGEDYSFCRRWRDIGGTVLVDPQIPMGHVGNKEYRATLADMISPKGNGHDSESKLAMEPENRREETLPA